MTLLGAAPAEAPAQAPPPPAPPPAVGYPPPPPPPAHRSGSGVFQPHARHHGRPAWRPERNPVDRPLSLSFGIGPGFLLGRYVAPDGGRATERSEALGYVPFRLGIGVAPGVNVTFSYEGAGTPSEIPSTGEASWLHQNVWLFGLQGFATQRLYLRGGAGFGRVGEESAATGHARSPTGMAFAGGVGYEFLQRRHVALGLEAHYSLARYSQETWHMGGLNLTLSIF